MDIIYTTGEPASIGAVAAVEAGGYADRVKIVGWDLQAQIIRGIDQGFVVGIVQQDPFTEGSEGVKAALKLIAGETVPKDILVPVTIVTQENVENFRSLFE